MRPCCSPKAVAVEREKQQENQLTYTKTISTTVIRDANAQQEQQQGNSRNSNNSDSRTDAVSAPCWQRGRTRQDSLRVAVSNIAALTGYHPYKVLPELLLQLLYQGRDGQALLQHDAAILGLELVDDDDDEQQHAVLRDLAQSAGPATVQALQNALNPSTLPRHVQEAAQRQEAVLRAARRDGFQLLPTQWHQLQQGLQSAVATQFGTGHESYALDWWQRTSQCEIRHRNVQVLEWPFAIRHIPPDEPPPDAPAPPEEEATTTTRTTNSVVVPMGPARARQYSSSASSRHRHDGRLQPQPSPPPQPQQCPKGGEEGSTSAVAAAALEETVVVAVESTNTNSDIDQNDLHGPENTSTKTSSLVSCVPTTMTHPSEQQPSLLQEQQQQVVDLTADDQEDEETEEQPDDNTGIAVVGHDTNEKTPSHHLTTSRRRRPFFYIVGSVDGIRDEWKLRPKSSSASSSHVCSNKYANDNEHQHYQHAAPNISRRRDDHHDKVANEVASTDRNEQDGKTMNNDDADDYDDGDDEWCLQSSVVEVKHRMYRLHKVAPPLYEQIQAVVYCLMYNVPQADLVQVLRRRRSNTQRKKRTAASSRELKTSNKDDGESKKRSRHNNKPMLDNDNNNNSKSNKKLPQSAPEVNANAASHNEKSHARRGKQTFQMSQASTTSSPSKPSSRKTTTLDGWLLGMESKCTAATTTTSQEEETAKVNHELQEQQQQKERENDFQGANDNQPSSDALESLPQPPRLVETTNSVNDDDDNNNNNSNLEANNSSLNGDNSANANSTRSSGGSINRDDDHDDDDDDDDDDVELECCVHCISLDDPITGHEQQWNARVLPRLQSMVELVYRIRLDDGRRYQWLLTVSQGSASGNFDEAWSLLWNECPWLNDCDDVWQARRRSSSSSLSS
ncbi:hypothetical protein ACA910_002764 [Epithemia clementina (nom. ined.)]